MTVYDLWIQWMWMCSKTENKENIKNNNYCRDTSIHYVKIDRDNGEEAAAKEYQQCDLF